MSGARRKTRRALTLAAVVGATLGVAACGSTGNSNTSTSSGGSGGTSTTSNGGKTPLAPSGTVKMAATNLTTKNDGSFGQATYEGMQQAEKEFPNLKQTAILESQTTPAMQTNSVDTLAPLNNLVLAVSSAFGPILDTEASKFPHTYFIDIAGAPAKLHPNVTGFNNDWGAPAYVAGVIAAHMTKTKVVGYVGGAQIPPTTQAAAAFKDGVHSVNPNIKVLSTLTGDFDNVSEAKAATTAQIDANADVIFPFLDAGIAGAYEAGKTSGKNPAMFKLTVPDCSAYPNMVGTEVVNNEIAAHTLIADYMHHTIKPGTILQDLQDPAVETLKLCPKYQANSEIANVTKTTIDNINSGKTKLPADAINPRPSFGYTSGLSHEG